MTALSLICAHPASAGAYVLQASDWRDGAPVPALTQVSDVSTPNVGTIFMREVTAISELVVEGHYSDAEARSKALVASERSHPETPDSLILAVNQLGDIQMAQGEFSQSEQTFLEMVDETRALHADLQMTDLARTSLAAVLLAESRTREVELMLVPAVQKALETLDPNDPLALEGLALDEMTLAKAYFIERNYAVAEKRIRESLSQTNMPDLQIRELRIFLAGLLDKEGKGAEAEAGYRAELSGVEAFGYNAGSVRWSLYFGLALTIDHQGRYAEAEVATRQALASYYRSPVFARAGADPSSSVMKATVAPFFQELGRLLRLQGEFGAAAAIGSQACQAIASAQGSSSGPMADAWASSSADCEREAVLEIANLALDGPGPVSPYAAGATPSADADHLSKADLSDRALRIVPPVSVKEDPASLLPEGFETAQRAELSEAGSALSQSSALAAATAAGAGVTAQAYEQAVERRSSLESTLGAQADSAQGSAGQNVAQQLAAADQTVATLAQQLQTHWRAYWDYRSPEPVTLARLQAKAGDDARLLHDNEALVVWMYAPGADKGLVFAVSKRGAAWAQMGLTGDQLDAKIVCLRAELDPQSYTHEETAQSGCAAPLHFEPALAHDLYVALMGDPRIQAVFKDVDTLLVAPSGPLTALPPSLLLVEAPAAGGSLHWLIRDKAVAVLPTVSSLASLRLLPRNGGAADHPLLGFVDPDFRGDGTTPGLTAPDPFSPGAIEASNTSQQLEPALTAAQLDDGKPPAEWVYAPTLAGTLEEGVQLAGYLGAPHDSLVYGPAATRAAVLARSQDGSLARAKVVVFATHGVVAGDFVGVDEPGLLMAQPPAGGLRDDWLLKASDVSTLKMHADWVLLSACDTAAPGAVGGDGLSGLARAFFYAGARTLLVTHWEIREGPARETVTETFRVLGDVVRHLTKAQALQQAQLELMSTDADPADWAPYVLVGDPD